MTSSIISEHKIGCVYMAGSAIYMEDSANHSKEEGEAIVLRPVYPTTPTKELNRVIEEGLLAGLYYENGTCKSFRVHPDHSLVANAIGKFLLIVLDKSNAERHFIFDELRITEFENNQYNRIASTALKIVNLDKNINENKEIHTTNKNENINIIKKKDTKNNKRSCCIIV